MKIPMLMKNRSLQLSFSLNKDIENIINRDVIAKRALKIETRRKVLERLIYRLGMLYHFIIITYVILIAKYLLLFLFVFN